MYPNLLLPEQRYCYSNEQTFCDPLDLIHGFVMADYAIGMHVQEFFEINVILRGSGIHYIETEHFPARQGDVFIIPPHISHGYVGSSGFDVYHFLINNRFMEKYAGDLQMLPSFSALFQAEPLMRISGSESLYLSLNAAQFETVQTLLEEIKRYSAAQTPTNSVICNSLALILITQLCQMYTEHDHSIDNEQIQTDAAFLDALSLIHEQYYQKLSIARLARTARMSRSAFLRKFRDVCKMPPAKYLTRCRIEAARRLLSNTALSLAEITIATGFYDASHLTKAFLSETGCTPGQYRKDSTASNQF